MTKQKLCHRNQWFRRLIYHSPDESNRMLQIALLLLGFMLMILQHYFQPFSAAHQLYIFLAGIIILGVPHGAADLLVAMQNAGSGKRTFSKLRFFRTYLGRLVLFAAAIWFFPIFGIMLFIIFAAYHFGETDLHHCKTDTILGKLLVTTYGLVILSVLLLVHFYEVKPIVQMLQPGLESKGILNLIDSKRTIIMAVCGAGFIFVTMAYHLYYKILFQKTDFWYLIRFGVILMIIFNLPLTMGFSFYFIVWHSVLSMINIFKYLRRDNLVPFSSILKQIGLYSFLAMVGILLIGLTGIMFLNSHTLMGYVFMGLAVLTAPHMQVMHDMYNKIRAN